MFLSHDRENPPNDANMTRDKQEKNVSNANIDISLQTKEQR